MDVFLINEQLFASQDFSWWTGVMWVTFGLLWCFHQLFGLSFWRHSFTAEDLLMSKWCYIYINLKKQTHLHLRWPEGEYILISGWTIPLILQPEPDMTSDLFDLLAFQFRRDPCGRDAQTLFEHGHACLCITALDLRQSGPLLRLFVLHVLYQTLVIPMHLLHFLYRNTFGVKTNSCQ